MLSWLGLGAAICTRMSQPQNSSCSSSQSCSSCRGLCSLAEHRAPPAALQAEQQEFGSSWSAGFALLPARSVQQKLKGAADGAALGGLCTP